MDASIENDKGDNERNVSNMGTNGINIANISSKPIHTREFIHSNGQRYSASWSYITEKEDKDHQEWKNKCYEKKLVYGLEMMVLNDDYKELTVTVHFITPTGTYTLEKNGTRTTKDQFMLLEWYELDANVYLIFNDEHGCLSVFDANSGKKQHFTMDEDVFISDYKRFGDYLYISGWVWQPYAVRDVFHIPSMIRQPYYQPISITTTDLDFDDCNKSVTNPGIEFFGCDTIEELLQKKDDIATEWRNKWRVFDFNRHRKDHSLLKLFLKHATFANEQVKLLFQSLLEQDQSAFSLTVVGNMSGENLYYATHFYHECRDKKYVSWDGKTYDTETDFNKIFANTLWWKVYDLPFPEINMTLTIQTKERQFEVLITHTLTDTPLDDHIQKIEMQEEPVTTTFGDGSENENQAKVAPPKVYNFQPDSCIRVEVSLVS